MEKRRRGRERAITLGILFLLVFTLDLSVRSREVADKSVDFQVISKMVVWLAAAIWSAVHWRRYGYMLREKLSWPWLALLGVLALTTFESISPALTFVSATSLFVCLNFLLFCLASQGERRTAATIIAAITLFLFVSAIFYFAVPELTRTQVWSGRMRVYTSRLAGLTPAPNVIGRMAGFCILLAFVYYKRLRETTGWLAPTALALSAAALVMSQSRTTMIAVLAAGVAWILIRRANRWLLPLMALAIAVGNFLILPNLMFLASALSRTGEATEILTLTNRVYIWRLAWWFFEQKPLFGWGYNTCGLHMALYAHQVAPDLGGYSPPHPHNVVLQMLFSGGVVACALFIVALASNTWALHKQANRIGLTLLVFWASTTLTEAAGFAGVAGVSSLAMFFPLGLALLPYSATETVVERRRRRRRKAGVVESSAQAVEVVDDATTTPAPVARVKIQNLDEDLERPTA